MTHTPLAVLINESDHHFRRLTSQPENMEITSLEDNVMLSLSAFFIRDWACPINSTQYLAISRN